MYRIGPGDDEVDLAADGFAGPNGVIFSADGRRLFVSDSRANNLRMFTVDDTGSLTEDSVFVECDSGNFDNIRFDDARRLWAAACGDGVHCYAADGTLIGKIKAPEIVANITFGGPKKNRMFLAANTTLYSLVMSVTGLKS